MNFENVCNKVIFTAITAGLVFFAVVLLSTCTGCAEAKSVSFRSVRVVTPAPRPPNNDLLKEAIKAQQRVIELLKADIANVETQLSQVESDIQDVKNQPQCKHNAAKKKQCGTSSLEGVKQDLEAELQELQASLAKESAELDALLKQLK